MRLVMRGVGWLAVALALFAAAIYLGYAPTLPEALRPGGRALAERLGPSPAWLTAYLRSEPRGAATAAAPTGAARGGPPGGARAVPVVLGRVEVKPAPVRFETIGTVQPIASVSLRARVDNTLVSEVLVEDGARVTEGQTLIRLDSRQVEAQIRQAEAAITKNRASLEQAERDVRRFEALQARDVGTQTSVDTARTLVRTLQAQIAGDQAGLDILRTQLTYYTLTAPISGRLGTIALKRGNVARGDAGSIIGQINQISPIYVSFALPQRLLNELRTDDPDADVVATLQGSEKSSRGKVAVLDNTVDATTGTIGVRAVFENADEALWPGALVNVRVTLRVDPRAIVIPREAVQTSQTGTFVFVVDAENRARVRNVRVVRQIDQSAVIEAGLQAGETVVTDGQLLLVDGALVAPRQGGAGQAGATAPSSGAVNAPAARSSAAPQAAPQGAAPRG